MKKLLAVYFSGTGNTAYATEKFCSRLSAAGIDCKIFSIEDFDMAAARDFNADTLLVAYPIYTSDVPRIMRKFISRNPEIFKGRDLVTLVTQHSFSGDGGALAARLVNNKKAHTASIHIKLPSNISDWTAVIKIKNDDMALIKKADARIEKCAADVLSGKPVKDGLGFFSWFAGFFVQRWWFRIFAEKRLRKGLKIDARLCSRCGKCAERCPMRNINISDGNIAASDNCTFCYRCINFCPRKAISLISRKKPTEQYKGIGGYGV